MARYEKPEPICAPPYETDEFRAYFEDALRRIPRNLIKDAIAVLNVDGFGTDRRNRLGVFEHNCLGLAQALACASVGLRCIDGNGIDEGGRPTSPFLGPKIPLGAAWQKEATTVPEKLKARWSGRGHYPLNRFGEERRYKHPRIARNWMLATGGDIVALDLDGQAGRDFLATYIAEYGDLPETAHQVTGSGGLQFLFRLPVGVEIRNTASAIAQGVDIRGDGGQIVGGGSIHPSGVPYRWRIAPWQCEIAEMPAILVDAALSASKATGAGPRASRSKRDGGTYTAGAPRERNPFCWDFEAKLDRIGDGDDRLGFDGPIRDAALQFFWEWGTDGEIEDLDYLRTTLRAAILAAPCKDRRNVTRYATDFYLDDRIAQALEFRRQRDAEYAAKRAEEEVEDDGVDEDDDLDADPEPAPEGAIGIEAWAHRVPCRPKARLPADFLAVANRLPKHNEAATLAAANDLGARMNALFDADNTPEKD